MSDAQKQEEGNSDSGSTRNNSVVDAVVFSQSEIRKNDFLQFVFLRNEELISCYLNIIRRVRGSGQKKLLTNMVERKKESRKVVLRKLGKDDFSELLAADGNISSMTKYMLDTDLRPVNSIIDVFAFISKKEQKELELFSRLAELEENSEVKEIFLEQTGVCKEHIEDLEADFAHLRFGTVLED
jgi:hypothetical protein